jgi:choline monooxygenase
VILTHPDSVRDADASEGLDQLERFWDLVNRQDLEIVERVQQGVTDPAYVGGRMCYRFEEPRSVLRRRVQRAMLCMTCLVRE